MVLNNIVFHAQCGHFLYYIRQFKASPLSIYDHRNRSTYAHTKKITQKQKALSELNQIGLRSEEHTSELQSLRRISYAVFC